MRRPGLASHWCLAGARKPVRAERTGGLPIAHTSILLLVVLAASWLEAASMGALANARGLMELILLNIGFEAGLISGKLYTILVLMTIVTTLVATPLQRRFERRLWKSGSKFGAAGEEPGGEDRQSSRRRQVEL